MKKQNAKVLTTQISVNMHSKVSCAFDDKSQIQLGIHLADEKAKKELLKRKMEAPLSTEERIFSRIK